MIAETHFAAPEEIMALLDGELSPERTQTVSDHLEQCAECREFAAILRASFASLANWTVPASNGKGVEFEERLRQDGYQAGLRAALPGLRKWLVPPWRRWVLGAATAALVAAVAITSVRHPSPAPRSKAVDFARTEGDAASAFRDQQEQLAMVREREANARMSSSLENDVATSASAQTMRAQRDEDAQVTVSENAMNSMAPMIARSFTLSMVVKDFGFSRTALDAILARHHGYAATLNASTQPNASRSLQASLRIPAVELSAAVAELKSLGQVENEAQSGEEVTQQHADLVARLKNSRETEQRLQAILLQRAGKIADVLAVEQEIARVRGEIEQMEAEQKSLEHRVDFATIDLNLGEEYKAQIGSASPSISTRFHNSLVAGYRNAVETVVGILLFLAQVGPSALIWLALLLPLAWFVRRRWVRAASLTF
jgi:hypothetical protein